MSLLEGQAGGEDKALSAALELVRRLAARDELALAEHCVTLEKWDRDGLRQVLDETVLLLRDALLCAAGAPCEADPVRREAARNAAAALSPRALSRAVSAAERLRDALTYNVGAGHLAGWLAAALSA